MPRGNLGSCIARTSIRLGIACSCSHCCPRFELSCPWFLRAFALCSKVQMSGPERKIYDTIARSGKTQFKNLMNEGDVVRSTLSWLRSPNLDFCPCASAHFAAFVHCCQLVPGPRALLMQCLPLACLCVRSKPPFAPATAFAATLIAHPWCLCSRAQMSNYAFVLEMLLRMRQACDHVNLVRPPVPPRPPCVLASLRSVPPSVRLDDPSIRFWLLFHC